MEHVTEIFINGGRRVDLGGSEKVAETLFLWTPSFFLWFSPFQSSASLKIRRRGQIKALNLGESKMLEHWVAGTHGELEVITASIELQSGDHLDFRAAFSNREKLLSIMPLLLPDPAPSTPKDPE